MSPGSGTGVLRMALITHKGGCKVGWQYWSTEAEAIEAGKLADAERDRKLSLGYDFGYQWPGSGSIRKIEHRDHGTCWVVTTP